MSSSLPTTPARWISSADSSFNFGTAITATFLTYESSSDSAFKNQDFFNGVVDRLSGIYQGSGLAREAELRADRVGLEYSTNAGYDGAGADRALYHLDLGSSIGGFMPAV